MKKKRSPNLTKQRSRSPRLDPADRRRLIVLAAIDSIATHGMHGTTFSLIARQAGIHQPLVNYYFPTFESLLIECIHFILEDLKVHMLSSLEADPHDPIGSLKSYMLSPLDWVSRKPKLQPLWLYFYHLSAMNERFRQLNKEIRQTGRERIGMLVFRILEKSQSRLPAGWDVDQVTLSIQSLITGFVVLATTEDSKIEVIKAILEKQINVLFKNLFNDSDRKA